MRAGGSADKNIRITLKLPWEAADWEVMDPRTSVDIAAPTPFGWVITTQTDFDLNTILSFRSQLASLSKFFETQKTVAPSKVAVNAEAVAQDGVLEPVYVRSA